MKQRKFQILGIKEWYDQMFTVGNVFSYLNYLMLAQPLIIYYLNKV